MSEINHKTPAITEPAQAKELAAAMLEPTKNASELEKVIEGILKKNRAAAVAAAQPQEPDWSKITEADSYNMQMYIPVIDHDLPDYMNMKLKDPEFECVWASTDNRRIGQLLAEGYEYLKPEHIHPDFKIPLPFNSEGHYMYVDVVCMRVHKRILYGKRRRGLELSQRQLGNNRRPPSARVKGTFELGETPTLGGGLDFYDPIM